MKLILSVLYFAVLSCNLLFSQTLNLTTSPQYVRVGDLDITGNQVTVEALVKNQGGVNIVSKHTGPPDVNYLMRIGTFELTTTVQFYLMTNPYAGSMLLDTWYHVAGTYDGSFIRYYVNGCLIVQQAASGNLINNNLITAIGNISSAPNAEQFYGEIDELRIWSTARTQAEIQANMFDLPAPTTQPGLRAYYKFDGNVTNLQGNAAFNGTWVGTPAYGTQPLPSVIPVFSLQSATPSDATCFGFSDGSITVSATGNSLQYSTNGTTWQNSNVLGNLTAGTYTVYVRTPEGCILNQANVTVGEPVQVNATAANTGPYCTGAPLQLNGSTTSGGTATFAWTGPGGYTSSVQNPADATAAGTYNLTVTFNGCNSPAVNTIVIVNATPVATPSNTGPYCPGQAIQLNGGPAGSTYAWSGPSGYSSAVQDPADAALAGTYTLIATQNGCASAPVSTNVVIHTLPVTDPVANITNCTGTTVNVPAFASVPAGATFAWTNSNTNTGLAASGTGNINPFTATNTGTASLTSTVSVTPSQNGCTGAPVSFDITIHPLPAATAQNNGPLCPGAPILLTADLISGASYSWTGPNGYTSNVQNPTDATVAGTYTVTLTANSCTGTAATTSVTINPTPVATALNTGPYCPAQPIQLNGGPAGAGYAWSGPSGYTSTVQNPTDATLAGTYTLIASQNGCASAPVNTTVVIHTLPVTNAVANLTDCVGTNINIPAFASVPAGATFAWTNSNANIGLAASGTGNINPFTALNTGTIPLTATVSVIPTLNGCPGNSSSFTITIHPLPPASAQNNGPLCPGETLNLTAGTVPGAAYAWTGPNGYTSNIQNPSINAVTVAQGGAYTVQVTLNGCVSDATTTFTVNPIITATHPAAGPFCESDNAVNLSASVPGGSWSGTGITDTATGTFDPSAAGAGTHTITYVLPGGCGGTSSLAVVVDPTPSINFIADVVSGCSPLKVTFNNPTASQGETFTWDFGDGSFSTTATPSHTFINPGCYDIQLVSTLGNCSATQSQANMICVFPQAVAAFSVDKLSSEISNTQFVFTNESSDATIFTWHYGDGMTSNQSEGPYTYPSQAGTYEVMLIANNTSNCSDTARITITIEEEVIMYVPNAFTPNGDERNNTFQPVMTAGFDPFDYTLRIYNRWGEQLFQSHNAEIGWDGTYMGALCESSTYVWTIEFRDNNTDKKYYYNGHTSLLK